MINETCLYIAKNERDGIIAFSPDMDYLFLYLKMFYEMNEDERIPIDIIREYDKNIIDKIFIDHEECQLIEIFPKIVVTSWEYSIWDDYFHEYYENSKSLIYNYVKKQLRMTINEEPTEKDIIIRMKKIFGPKYFHISTYENFIGYLGEENIRNIFLNNKDMRYLYELKKDFNRYISSDI